MKARDQSRQFTDDSSQFLAEDFVGAEMRFGLTVICQLSSVISKVDAGQVLPKVAA